MNVKNKLIEEGINLGKALKEKNVAHYAKTKIHIILEPYSTINDKIECLLDFSVKCDKELPTEIISGENREKDIQLYIAGVIKELNK